MIIAIVNQKGGCGKTSSSVALTYWLHKQGKNLLLIDADAQESSSHWLSGMSNVSFKTIHDPEEIFEQAAASAEDYDAVVIDGPGSFGEHTKSALLVADLAIIPVQPSELDLAATKQVIRLVHNVQKIRNGAPKAAVFVNRAEKRSLLLKETRSVLSNIPGVKLLNAVIYRRAVIADSPGQHTTIFNMSGQAAADAAADYSALFEEALAYGKQIHS